MTLPSHATEASHKRYQLALHLVETCPPEMADEIALTGSTARGLADEDSDLELNLWSEKLLPAYERIAWLEAAGVQNIEVFQQPRPDGSYWIGGRIDDVPLEAGWQTYEVMEEMIENLLSGKTPPSFADILVSAVPLRSQGGLSQWQERLRAYPDAAQAQVIRRFVSYWSAPGYFEGMFKLARRGERLVLMEFLVNNLNVMMWLLYAVNRRWHPGPKRALTFAHDLPHMPVRWRERIDEVLTASPEESIRLCAELLLDSLTLVPSQYDVTAAVEVLQAGIADK
jgi:hypothetical protein